MNSLRTFALSTLGALVLVSATMAPARANDASVSFHGATATYTDATDNLCARAIDDFSGLEDYAIAEIVNDNGAIVFQKFDTEGGGQSCTGNLSIPEDRRYRLRVWDCSRVPGTDCGVSPSEYFYS